MIYGNESDVGKALKESEVKREDIFITTKVWNSDQGYDSTLKACESSLKRLDLSYVNLYLIHWPVREKIIETWKAMIKLLNNEKAKAIGVSNYSIEELKETIDSSDIVPAINQVEFHPYLYQKEILRFCKSNVIQLEAYSPLTRGKRLSDPKIVQIAKAYDKTPAQILVPMELTA